MDWSLQGADSKLAVFLELKPRITVRSFLIIGTIIYLKRVETNISLKLNNSQFYPDSYAMPKEKERFEEGKIEENFDFIILGNYTF